MPDSEGTAMSETKHDGPFSVEGVVASHPLSTAGMIEVRNGYGDVAYFQDYPGLNGRGNAQLFVAAPSLLSACKAVTGLIGNVDHSQGNGANSAKLRGELLNGIRGILDGAIRAAEGSGE